MNPHALLEMQLRSLNLQGMLSEYERLLKSDPQPLEYLEALISIESTRRDEATVQSRIHAARFPVLKTIESFDFSLQPELPKVKVLSHFDGKFIDEHRNVIFCGPPGVGKSHILSALGLSMCMKKHRVLFTTAASLLMKLIDAKRSHSLSRVEHAIDRFDLLLIDELGYIPFEREATDLLVGIISQRYERKSIALTTNLAFEKWTQVFPDEMTATAVIDRLVHHGTVFAFTGESQRLRKRGTATKKV